MGKLQKTFPSVPVVLQRLQALRKEVKSAKTFEQLDRIERTAAGIQKAFRPVREVSNEAGEVWTDALVRLRAELDKLPKAKGTRGQLQGKRPATGKGKGRAKAITGGSKSEPPVTLAQIGVTKKRAAQAKAVQAIPEATRKRIVADLKADDRDVTPANIIKAHKEETRGQARAKYAAMAKSGGQVADLTALAKTGQKFSAIYADPPWTFEVYSGKGKDRSAERHYDTMTLEQISALPVAALAADDCALFLWGVWPEMPGALEVIQEWGFQFKTMAFIWVKTTPTAAAVALDGDGLHWGMGYWTRANSEPCLFATRGSPKRLDMGVHQVVVAPVARHSEKPEAVRTRIERLVPGPYLELFARQPVEGWTTWGNEILVTPAEAAE